MSETAPKATPEITPVPGRLRRRIVRLVRLAAIGWVALVAAVWVGDNFRDAVTAGLWAIAVFAAMAAFLSSLMLLTEGDE